MSAKDTKKKKKDKDTLSERQKDDILKVYEMFKTEESGMIKAKDLKIAMRALGFEPKREEVRRILIEANKEDSEFLSFNDFLCIMSQKFAEKDVMEEIKKAFNLFDEDNTGVITLKNLKRAAKELGEKFKDEDLQEMIDEADKDGDGAINLEEFAYIMRKTNLY